MQAASLSSITMNMSQNISNIHSKQCDFGLKAAALCKENYPIPSCPQLRQSCCTPTLTWLFSFGIKLLSLSPQPAHGHQCSDFPPAALQPGILVPMTWKAKIPKLDDFPCDVSVP